MLDQVSLPRYLLLIYPLFIFIPFAFFFFSFLKKYLRSHQKMFLLLSILFATAFTSQILLLLMPLRQSESIAEGFFFAAQILELFSFIVLVAIMQLFEGKSSPYKMLFFTTVAAIIVGAMITSPSLVSYEVVTLFGTGLQVQFERRALVAFLMLIFSFLIFVWIIFTYITKQKKSRNKEQKKLITWLFLGILLSQLVGSFAPAVVETTIESTDVVDVFSSLGVAKFIGIFIVGIAFYRVSRKPWLLQLQATHVLVVYTRYGITLFNRIFRTDINETDIQMLAGALTAVSSLFNEATKETNPIQSIQFKGKDVCIIDKGSFISALMVDFTSEATIAAHENFVAEFQARFARDIENFTGNVNTFENAAPIAQKYFT